MFKRLVVAVDGSAQSEKAAKKAFDIASLTGAVIHAVYVIDSISDYDVLITTNTMEVQEQRLKKLVPLEKEAKEKDITFDMEVLYGEVASSLTRFAKEKNADLIVVGSRGLNRLQQLILGSVSQSVVRKATCSVLIVK